MTPTASEFAEAYQRFQDLVEARSGHRFVNFTEGLVAAWEGYKTRLRDLALDLLAPGTWSEADIGSGVILGHAIAAIEIQDGRSNLINNLVFWQNRFGHANRDHRVLLEAVGSPKLRMDLERLLFRLYRGGADEGEIFERLAELTGRKYPLLAYLYFLKDIDRFMPINPTGFDRAFQALGIEFSTLRQCNWENYSTFNAVLAGLRPMIADAAGVGNVRLIDAHSFCWLFSTLIRDASEGDGAAQTGGHGAARVVGGRERSIIEMRLSVLNTVRNSNGQLALHTVRNKDTSLTDDQLDRLIGRLLDVQENRCALTGIRFHFYGPDADASLLPSVDRIDSRGHYEEGNLQVVCRFINFWKGSFENDEFRRLLCCDPCLSSG